jgi:hypothetical protein
MKAIGKVAVIIPFYRDTVSHFEEIALQQCEKVLGNYAKIAIKPQHLLLPQKAGLVSFNNVVEFDDKYFSGIEGYNSLMLSEVFYKAFLDYEYILIYQLDAFVFKDELAYWCSQNYDYIGAPWLRRKGYKSPIKSKAYQLIYKWHRFFNLQKGGLPTEKQFYDRVGNGGLSLRRVNKFYNLAIELRVTAQEYLNKGGAMFNEDAFWSIEVNRKLKRLNIPEYKTGVKFSIELHPERALELNAQQLPFGCHAWDLHLTFWRDIFSKYGYKI